MASLKTAPLGMARKWRSSLVLGAIVGAVIFALILAWGGVDEVWEERRGVDFTYLWIYVGLTVVMYLLRAWRFHLLLGISGAVPRLYGIVSVHTLMINLLPFSTGEISYPVLLKRYGVSKGYLEGIPSLVIARVQDVFIYGSFLLAALLWVGDPGLVSWGGSATFPVAFLLSLLAVAAGGTLLYRRLPDSQPFVRQVKRVLSKVGSSFTAVSRAVWITTFLTTFVARLVSVIGVYYLFKALGISIPLSLVLLISSLYVFLPYLPINTPAGLGIFEGYLLAFFIYSGMERGAATAASVQIHLLQLMVAAVLGAIGLAQLQYLKRRRYGRAQPVIGRRW